MIRRNLQQALEGRIMPFTDSGVSNVSQDTALLEDGKVEIA
jgi:hypothetical protein